ncbi:MAG: acyl-CoA reductase, partial [bacterium]
MLLASGRIPAEKTVKHKRYQRFFYPLSRPLSLILSKPGYELEYPEISPEQARVLKEKLMLQMIKAGAEDFALRWGTILRVSRFWLNSSHPLLDTAYKEIASSTGYAEGAVRELFQHFFSTLAHHNRPPISRIPPFWQEKRRFVVHICSGNIPTASFPGILLAYLLGTAQLVKVAEEDPFSPYYLIWSLRKCASSASFSSVPVAVIWWKGGQAENWEKALASEADVVAVYGTSEPVAYWRKIFPSRRTFLPYGPKISFQILGKRGQKLAQAVALDTVLFDQQGCMSPHWCFLVGWKKEDIYIFARELAKKLVKLSGKYPPRDKTLEEKVRIRSAINLYRIKKGTVLVGDLESGMVIVDKSREILPS